MNGKRILQIGILCFLVLGAFIGLTYQGVANSEEYDTKDIEGNVRPIGDSSDLIGMNMEEDNEVGERNKKVGVEEEGSFMIEENNAKVNNVEAKGTNLCYHDDKKYSHDGICFTGFYKVGDCGSGTVNAHYQQCNNGQWDHHYTYCRYRGIELSACGGGTLILG